MSTSHQREPANLSLVESDTLVFPLELEKPMTLIAAMDCGDSLLIGSDSLVTEDTDIKVVRQKLWVRPSPPVAFGFSGGDGVGLRFRDWFLWRDWAADLSWPSFADLALRELSRLNGERREMARLAHVEAKEDDLAKVLLAGAINGRLDIWELTNDGGGASVKEKGFVSIGSGAPHAFIAYRTLSVWAKQPNNVQTMAVSMDVAVSHAPMCQQPIKLIRLTANGALNVVQKPDGKWTEEPVT